MLLSWHRCAQYAMFFGYSGGRGRPLSRGTPRGRRKASGGGRFGKRVKTRWIRGPGAPKRVKNAYERCTPHGAVGQTVLPTASGVSPPGSRGAVSRGLRPSWPSPAGSVAGSAHRAVEAKFRPAALGGVRAARVPFRGSVLLHSYVFYRATHCGSGAQNPRFSQLSKPVYAADSPVASRCRHPAVRPIQVGENLFFFGAPRIPCPCGSGARTIGHRWSKPSGQTCVSRKRRRVFCMHLAHRPCVTSIRKYARLARKGRQELHHQAPLCLLHCFVI